ncbi:MAG: hypothetical protein K0S07_187 [Chlamydiales bacterium]|jgi:tetratricopeptide (TPR) repeat protein|nr:hypothetical protein [Chlamydiales bacterium]
MSHWLSKTIQEMYKGRSLQRLEEFKDVNTWSPLPAKEKELLALLFVMQGEKQLKKHQGGVFDSFAMAERLAPQSAKVYYRQGKVLAAHAQNEQSLKMAADSFSKATSVNPLFFDAWYQWGVVLTHLALLGNQAELLQEAEERFLRAYPYLPEKAKNKRPEFFWRFGICQFAAGRASGEPADLFQALRQFERALAEGCSHPKFFNDYGNLIVHLSTLIQRPGLLEEAVSFYQRALKELEPFFEAELNLAVTCQELYSQTFKQSYLLQATQAFQKAGESNPDSFLLWLKWGQLLTLAGQELQSSQKIKEALEKFAIADACEPNQPSVLLHWAKSELLLGMMQERLDLLKGAEEKVIKSIELHEENAFAWEIYGDCLYELGRYFSDEVYYLKAIEKYQRGISLKESASLWQGVGLCYTALGSMQDQLLLLKAIDSFEKAIKLEPPTPHLLNDLGIAFLKRGELYRQQEDVELGIHYFEKAIELMQEQGGEASLDFYYNLGCALDYLGDYCEDEKHYERACQVLSFVLSADPTFEAARYNLALALSHLGEMTADSECLHQAARCFETIIEQDPEDDLALAELGVTWISLAQLNQDPGYADLETDLMEKAESSLYRAASLGNTASFYHLACLYALRKDCSLALYFLNKAKEVNGLPFLEEMLQDDWLSELKADPSFKAFIQELSAEEEDESI